MSGPPLTYSTDYNTDAALDAAAEGKTMPSIAEAMGLQPRHLRRLLARDAEFNQAMTHARIWGYMTIAESVLRVHEEFPEAHPQLLRVISENRQWFLKVMHPVQYGDKVQVQVEHVDLKGALTEARTRVITIDVKPTNHSDAPE
jgi:acyl dehydratase